MNTQAFLGIIASTLLAGALAASAQDYATAPFVDFEDPVYVPNAGIGGVDAWVRYGGTTNSLVVSPTAGGYQVLSGTKSMLQASSGTIGVRPFVNPVSIDQGSTVSWRFWVETVNTNTVNHVGLANSVGSATVFAGVGVGTPAGGPQQQWMLVGEGSNTHSGIQLLSTPFNNPDVHLVEMELDLAGQEFTAYITNETQGGPRTLLGTKGFGTNALPGGVFNGGLTVYNPGEPGAAAPAFATVKTGGHVILVDDIETTFLVIAEPSFDTIEQTNTFAFSFDTQEFVTYDLQFVANPAGTNWMSTGLLVEGNGDTRLAYDPAGFSTQKTYRIVATK